MVHKHASKLFVCIDVHHTDKKRTLTKFTIKMYCNVRRQIEEIYLKNHFILKHK